MEQKTLPNATASLVLGILSIPTCFCYGLLGLILGIVAIVLGNKAKKLDAANPGEYKGVGNAKAGVITGIIGTILGAIYLIIILFFIATVGWAAMQDPGFWEQQLQ